MQKLVDKIKNKAYDKYVNKRSYEHVSTIDTVT